MTIYYSPSAGGFFDPDINSSIPEDVIEIDSTTHAMLVEGVNNDGKKIVFDGTNITLQEKDSVNADWTRIRKIRKRLIKKTDYTQLSDWPGDKEAWATYRQALRDIPTTFSNPADVVWPTPPGE